MPPEPLMHGTSALLVGWNVTVAQPVAWVWRFRADGTYTLRYTGTAWQLSRERAEPADVLIDTTAEAWHALLTAPPGQRRLTHPDFHLAATAAAWRNGYRLVDATTCPRASQPLWDRAMSPARALVGSCGHASSATNSQTASIIAGSNWVPAHRCSSATASGMVSLAA